MSGYFQSLFPKPELFGSEEILSTETTPETGKSVKDSPYLIVTQVIQTKVPMYNPDFAGHRAGPEYSYGPNCECGHAYTRHFDGYDDNRATGCKYCACYHFKLPFTG